MLTCVQLTQHIRQISDDNGYCSSLVTGTRNALLFDTMIGAENLLGFVRCLTDLPLIVVNSHGHFDHTGGNNQFDEVYLNHKDLPVLKKNMRLLEKINRRKNILDYKINDLTAGNIFNLGDVILETVALPGHTPGSIGLLLREEKILLAGDAFTPMMCLFFPESMPLNIYKNTLEYAKKLDFEQFVLGHYTKLFPKSLLEIFTQCADLPGKIKSREFFYSLIPEYRGRLYFLEYFNKDAESAVCIITKEGVDFVHG